MSVGPHVTIDGRSASSPANCSTPTASKFPEKVKAFFRNHNYTLENSDNEEFVFHKILRI